MANTPGTPLPLRSSFLFLRSLSLLALVAVIVWSLGSDWFLRREFHATLNSEQAISSVRLEWTRPGNDFSHGVWIDDEKMAPDTLEVRPSGKASTAGKAFEFWLYHVKDGSGNDIDLKKLIASKDPQIMGGTWIPFEQGPGVIYVGQEPGYLRLPISTRDVHIEHASTDMGGIVDFHFRGQTMRLDSFADSVRGSVFTLPNGPVASEAIQIIQQLPTYTPSAMSLSWKGPAGALVSVEKPTLVHSLLGMRVSSREVATSAGVGVAPGSTPNSWKIENLSPSVALLVDHGAGLIWWIVGLLATFASCVATWLTIRTLCSAGRWMHGGLRRTQFILLLILLAVNLLLALGMPVYVTSDGMDYIDGAAGLAFDNHNLDRMPGYKAPGLMFVLAVCMRLGTDFLQVFALMQGFFSLCISVLAYLLLRDRAGKGWATLAGVVLGLHPVLLTYQAYLLRENLAAMLFLATAASLFSLDRASRENKNAVLGAITLGIICGLGALVRENFQLLLIAVPIATALVVRGSWPRRTMAGGIVLLAGFLTIMPYLAIKCWPNDVVGIVSKKTDLNRALNTWTNRVADGNDSAFLSHEEWLEFETRAKAGTVSDFDFVNRLKTGTPFLDRLRTRGMKNNPSGEMLEQGMKEIADEAMARDPLAQLRSSGVSFANQLGLWNFYSPPDASSGSWYARALRGRFTDFPTNYHVGTNWMLTNPIYTNNALRLEQLVRQTVRTQDTGDTNFWHRLFNEWFWFVHFLRPVVAILFLVGVWRALKRGDRALAAVGFITLFMIGTAAAVVAPATDRFAAPFIPVLICFAIHTVVDILRERREAKALA